MRVVANDAAGHGPGRICSPRHRMPLNPRNEGSKRVGLESNIKISARPSPMACARGHCSAAVHRGRRRAQQAAAAGGEAHGDSGAGPRKPRARDGGMALSTSPFHLN
jgi:hypothetical protein